MPDAEMQMADLKNGGLCLAHVPGFVFAVRLLPFRALRMIGHFVFLHFRYHCHCRCWEIGTGPALGTESGKGAQITSTCLCHACGNFWVLVRVFASHNSTGLSILYIYMRASSPGISSGSKEVLEVATISPIISSPSTAS